MSEPLIDDATHPDDLVPFGVCRGLVERDYGVTPMRAVEMPLIPRSEWSARIKEMEETRSRLSDIWHAGGVRHLDQNGQGYCWAYAATHAVMALRAVMGQPHVRLSGHAVGCLVKGYRDEGGWSALALQHVAERGVPSVEAWPEKSMSRANDTPAMRENALLHRVTEAWIDVAAPVWNRDLSWDQVMTLLLSRVPVCADYDFWGHAVCLLDPVEVEPGSYGVRLVNSWNGWGDRGMGVLRGSRAIPSNAVAPRVTNPSTV